MCNSTSLLCKRFWSSASSIFLGVPIFFEKCIWARFFSLQRQVTQSWQWTANGGAWDTIHISSSSLDPVILTGNLKLLVLLLELGEKGKPALPFVSDGSYTLEHLVQRPQLSMFWREVPTASWDCQSFFVVLIQQFLVSTFVDSFAGSTSLLQVNIHRNSYNKCREFSWPFISLWLQENSTSALDYENGCFITDT